MTYVYIDWNVFDAIKKINTNSIDVYTEINNLIIDNKIIAPYSNAHISDLYRGYLKNSSYIDSDLEIIQKITNGLCLTQYWGENSARWHYRSPLDFFQDMLNESNFPKKDFSELFSFDDTSPVLENMGKAQLNLLRLQQLPKEFKSIYQQDNIFSLIFPKSRIEMNLLALCADIYDLSFKMQKDFALYKSLRKYLTQAKLKFPKLAKSINESEKGMFKEPKQLIWDDLFELFKPKFKESSNPNYDKIINLFISTDLKGYNKDERFANMLDDALHTFYAAHCDYFISNDVRCMEKAKLVYKKLGIQTVIVKPEEFVKLFNK